MKDEIKEILDIFKKINEEYSLDTELDFEDYEIPNIYLKALLDYITNLQEENERLTQGTTVLTNKIIDMTKENERLKDEIYSTNQVVNELLDIKSRKDKAIEYLANCDWNCKDFEKLYDILGGDDNE